MIDLRKADGPSLRAAWWAFGAAGRARRQLRSGGLEALGLRAAPALPSHAERGVRLALRCRREPCLVSAAVRQAWFAGQGSQRDLVVGVRAPEGRLEAHAWLEGDSPPATAGYMEITRR